MRVTPARDHELAPVQALAHAPALLEAYAALGRFAHGGHELDPSIRALAMQLAAVRAGCAWCIDYGLWTARGVDPEKLTRVAEHARDERYGAAERAALALADEMTEGPVEDATFEEARRHFSERELVELVGVVAAEIFFNRLNLALGVEEQGFCAVPPRE